MNVCEAGFYSYGACATGMLSLRRKKNRKDSSFAFFTFNGYCAFMLLNNFIDNGQTKAAPRIFGCKKRIENAADFRLL